MDFSRAFYEVNNYNNEENEELSAAAAYGVPSHIGHSLTAGNVTPPPGSQRARDKIPTLEEELRRTSSPFHNMIRRQHAELAALRARGVSPNTLNYARRSHMEERERRMMRSPLPPAPPPPPPERHIPLREMTREQLMKKHRNSLDYATRVGSPDFLAFTKEIQEKELGDWEAAQVGRPPAAAAAAYKPGIRFDAFPYNNNNDNNNNNNNNAAELAFGSLGPLSRNPLTGIRVEKRRERNTRKQRTRKQRSKSRRNRRYTRR